MKKLLLGLLMLGVFATSAYALFSAELTINVTETSANNFSISGNLNLASDTRIATNSDTRVTTVGDIRITN